MAQSTDEQVENISEHKPELGLVDVMRRTSSEDPEATALPMLVARKEVGQQNGQACNTRANMITHS